MAIGFNTTSAHGSLQIIPDKGLGRTFTPRVSKVSFGDGYEQRRKDGINAIAETFSVQIQNKTDTEIQHIVDFFNSLNGVSSFNLTLPKDGGEETIKVVCENYSYTYKHHDYYDLNASFRRVFEP